MDRNISTALVLVFAGRRGRIISRRFSMLVHLLIKFVNKLSNIFKVVEFITSDMQTIITQYLVTVDLFSAIFAEACLESRALV